MIIKRLEYIEKMRKENKKRKNKVVLIFIVIAILITIIICIILKNKKNDIDNVVSQVYFINEFGKELVLSDGMNFIEPVNIVWDSEYKLKLDNNIIEGGNTVVTENGKHYINIKENGLISFTINIPVEPVDYNSENRTLKINDINSIEKISVTYKNEEIEKNIYNYVDGSTTTDTYVFDRPGIYLVVISFVDKDKKPINLNITN